MRGLETGYVISGPMRGLKKHIQTYGHNDFMTDPAQTAKSVKIVMQLRSFLKIVIKLLTKPPH